MIKLTVQHVGVLFYDKTYGTTCMSVCFMIKLTVQHV